mmetsp:Transcript_23625/g.33002  ORF Transcript_23625/g.33002 Transcript_23625/m.33002 type:complete len:241 (-) Transcript_23625:669-1391(-)
MRFTIKPGQSLQITGTFASWRAKRYPVATASKEVEGPLMTSTRGILPTGLKKWIPTHRSGVSRTEASSVMLRELVFVAMTQEGGTIFSSSWKIFFFRCITSTAASIIKSQSLNPSTLVPPVTNAMFFSAASEVMRPFSTRLWKVLLTSSSPFCTTSSLMSRMYTRKFFFAHKTAICEPITPAPTIPIFFGSTPLAPWHFSLNFFEPSIILKREINALLWDELPSTPKCLASSASASSSGD